MKNVHGKDILKSSPLHYLYHTYIASCNLIGWSFNAKSSDPIEIKTILLSTIHRDINKSYITTHLLLFKRTK